MKRLVLLLAGGLGCSALAAPQMEVGTLLANGADLLQVATMSAPAVLDWNNDGRKDLLVGDSAGYIWLFLNLGTDAAPQFNGRTQLKSGSSAIITDSGG
jgi:hypothetical protein